jgi:hypothetical protein
MADVLPFEKERGKGKAAPDLTGGARLEWCEDMGGKLQINHE